MNSSFAPILKRVVERVPGATGAIFAASDGEAVDVYSLGDRHELCVVGAHCGIILNHVQNVLHLFHFGEAEVITLIHDRMQLLVRAVARGYYVVVAVSGENHLATALAEIAQAAAGLKEHM